MDDHQAYTKLRREILRKRRVIYDFLAIAEKDKAYNFTKFKRLADLALENLMEGIEFLDNGLIEDAALCTIEATTYFMAACSATGEPFKERGRRALKDSQKGHIMTYGTTEDKQQRVRELQMFIQDMKNRRPDIKKHTPLCREAAKHKDCPHKLAGRTIQKLTEDPYK